MGLSLKRGLVLGSVACLGLAFVPGAWAVADTVSVESVVSFGSLFDTVGSDVGGALAKAFGVGAGVMIAFLIFRVIKRAGGAV